MAASRPPDFLHLSSSSESLSSPSYSLREDRDGQLVSRTQERVVWPHRPSTGKYSEAEERKYRRKSRQLFRQPSSVPVSAFPSDILGPEVKFDETLQIDSEMLKRTDQDFSWPNKGTSRRSPSNSELSVELGHPVVARKTYSFMLGPESTNGEVTICIGTEMMQSSADELVTWVKERTDDRSQTTEDESVIDGEKYTVVGKWSRKEVLQKLGGCCTTVVFEEEGKLQLALAYEKRKYILPVMKMEADGRSVWGVSKTSDPPEVSFVSLEKLARFYSTYPLTAFLHL